MLKTNAELIYSVWVTCPHCGEDMDLVDQDADHFLAARIFGDADNKADWQDTGLEFECVTCNVPFELENIEY